MGLFSTPNPHDAIVEKATDERNTSEDWAMIMEVCDRASMEPKEVLKSICKRLNHQNPIIVMQAITLLDACVNNSGKKFHLEVCSRDFETELRRLIKQSPHPKTAEKLKLSIKKWSESEFKSDPQLSLIPALYQQLRREGHSFKSSDPASKKSHQGPDPRMLKNPNYVGSAQEEEDIAKAIEMSLKETSARSSPTSGGGSTMMMVNGNAGQGRQSSVNHHNHHQAMNGPTSQQMNNHQSSSMYPSFNNNGMSNGTSVMTQQNAISSTPGQIEGKEPYKVRALYDFEAAEDNELTFKAGELIIVADDSDANWWKGSNHRGDGLFPANFVTTDLDADHGEESVAERQLRAIEKRVSFSEDVKVKVLEATKEEPVEIDEEKIDRMLHLTLEADTTGEKGDNEEIIQLEEMCTAMGPLIDAKLEEIDAKHAALTGVLASLNNALTQYHELMRESFPPHMAAAAASNGYMQAAPPSLSYASPPQSYPSYQQAPPQQQQWQYQVPYQQPPSMIPNGAMPPQQPPPGAAPTQVTYSHQSHAHNAMPPNSQPQQPPQMGGYPPHHMTYQQDPQQQQQQPPVGMDQQPQYLGPAPPTHDPNQQQQQQPQHHQMAYHHPQQQYQQPST